MQYVTGPYVYDTSGPYARWNYPAGAITAIDLRSYLAQNTPGVAIFLMPDDVIPEAGYRVWGQGPSMGDIFLQTRHKNDFAREVGVAKVEGDSLADWLYTALAHNADPTGQAACKPLMPTTKRRNEVWLGGLVKRISFDIKSPDAALVIDMLQREYREARKQARDGKVISFDGEKHVVDTEHHRRVLKVWGEKYGLNNPEDVFIPNDVPKETALEHRTTITESFNTADSTTLGPDLAWTEQACFSGLSSDFVIRSNTAKNASGNTYNAASANTALSSSDNYAQATVQKAATAAPYPGVGCRWTVGGTFSDFYLGRIIDGSADKSSKLVGGAETGIGTSYGPQSDATNYTMYAEASGSSITFKIDGSAVGGSPITDTTISSGTKCGIAGYSDSLEKAIWDAFEAGDLAGGGGGSVGHRVIGGWGGRVIS